MSNKHFINDSTQLVLSALRSIPYTNPSLAVEEDNKVVYRKAGPNQVAIVSGGGAGHEPAFANYVGDGILRAAVSGSIFASPSVKQIYNCITRLVNPNKGVLLIVMNYTGDVLHFGLATEKARAAGVDIDMVVVDDDVGVGREKSGKVGRRGLAGSVMVQKIAGAYAAQGGDLKTTAGLARLVCKNLISVGSSLAHVHIPGHSETDYQTGLKQGEVELGMGIHNEQGSKRMKMPELPELVNTMLKQLLGDDADRNYLEEAQSQGWVLMVNNLGGVSPLELGGITAEVCKQVEEKYDIKPKRIYSGTFMTSLNGNGFMVTLLRLVDTGLGEGKGMIDLLDAPHETAGWTPAVRKETWEKKIEAHDISVEAQDEIAPGNLKMDTKQFSDVLSAGLHKLVAAEGEITEYDVKVGDGDCGQALKNGAEAVLKFISDGKVTEDVAVTVGHLAEVIEDSIGGTSGAIYSIFVNALAQALREKDAAKADLGTWATAALTAMVQLRKYTPAQPGDRTLVDALQPFIVQLAEKKDLAAAAKAAREGAEKTRGAKAKLGRSVYVGDIGDTPDPGAIGVAVFVEGMAGL